MASQNPVDVDFRQARQRRRFYVERGLRKRPIGAGSDLRRLMALSREELPVRPEDVLGEIPGIIVGGVAARAYAPERMTKDLDIMVESPRFMEAKTRLRACGWTMTRELFFPNTALGLWGEAWERNGVQVDIITTDQHWGRVAFAQPAYDQTGVRVIPLAYLVLMKIDSAHGIDQGDLTRMLGRLSDDEVEAVAAVVNRHSNDPQAAGDVRRYALLGRHEWE